MAIKTQARTISREKLQKLTNDHETTKYLEYLQSDIAGPVSEGIDNAQDDATTAKTAAVAAQQSADTAQASAASAQAAAVSAQSTASNALTSAGAAQTAAGNAQTSANNAGTAASNAQTDATYARNLANTINANYVTKAGTAAQAVGGTFQATAFLVGSNQVVGARQTGWTAGTGTVNKGAFAADTAYAASAAYTQAEATAAYSSLQQARQRILALETALRTHGLIN